MPTAIRAITAEICLPLRQRELWPNRPLDFLRTEGDDQAQHYGLYLDDRLICCLSVFQLEGHARQIRKFATEAPFQRQGYGSTLLKYVLGELQAEGIHHVMLNARLTAIEFYARFGFQKASDVHHLEEVSYIQMVKNL